MSQVTSSITLKDGSAADIVYTTSSKDTGYQRYTHVPAGQGLTKARSVSMKLTQPAKLSDTSEIKNRIIVMSPNFDAEGASLAPNVVEIKVTTLAVTSQAEKADLVAAGLSFLDLASIKAQIIENDNLI